MLYYTYTYIRQTKCGFHLQFAEYATAKFNYTINVRVRHYWFCETTREHLIDHF